ncbi:hypothetical protein L1887_56995 [Cichorium endivia]|nr:hypothetical protein L1887_56995 [Cichorium endivia]
MVVIMKQRSTVWAAVGKAQPQGGVKVEREDRDRDRDRVPLRPHIEQKPGTLLEQLHLLLGLVGRALGLLEDLGKDSLDVVRHALGLAADVDVRLALQDVLGDLLASLPEQVLHVHLGAVRLELFARQRGLHDKLAAQLLGVLRPLVAVEKVLVGASAAVEEPDVAPILERLLGRLAALLHGLFRAAHAVLHKRPEGRHARARSHHDHRDLGRRRQAEVGSSDVDGRAVLAVLGVDAARTRELVLGCAEARVVGARRLLAVLLHLDAADKVGGQAVHPRRLLGRLVAQHHRSDVHRLGVHLGARRDRVEARADARQVRDDAVKRDAPRLDGTHVGLQVVAGHPLHGLGGLEQAAANVGLEGVLVGANLLELGADVGRWSKLGKAVERLARCVAGDVEVVAEDGFVGGGHGEGHLGERGVERLDVDDRVALVEQAKDGEGALHLLLRVVRPHGDVVAVLVRDAGAVDVELDVHAGSVGGALDKELARLRDDGVVGVLGVVDALGAEEGTGGELSVVHLVLRVVGELGDLEVGHVASAALLKVERRGERLEHRILPGEVVLLHALVVVALAALADALCAERLEACVELAGDGVEVLVGAVAEAKDDVVEVLEAFAAVGEFGGFVLDELHEADGVVCRLALAVGGHDKDGYAVVGHLVELFKLVLFGVEDEGGGAEASLCLLGELGGILFGGAGLGAVEDGDALLLRLELGDEVGAALVGGGKGCAVGELGASVLCTAEQALAKEVEDGEEAAEAEHDEVELRSHDEAICGAGRGGLEYDRANLYDGRGIVIS